MDYNHITEFLNKFNKIIFQKEERINIVFEIIKKHINFPIKKEIIKIKNNFILIKASPILRGEILIHKQDILSEIKEKLPNQNFIDIK